MYGMHVLPLLHTQGQKACAQLGLLQTLSVNRPWLLCIPSHCSLLCGVAHLHCLPDLSCTLGLLYHKDRMCSQVLL